MQEEPGLTCIKTYFIMRDGKRKAVLAGRGGSFMYGKAADGERFSGASAELAGG